MRIIQTFLCVQTTRTLTSKQQCNPENSKKKAERKRGKNEPEMVQMNFRTKNELKSSSTTAKNKPEQV